MNTIPVTSSHTPAADKEAFYADHEAWEHEFCEPDAECCTPEDRTAGLDIRYGADLNQVPSQTCTWAEARRLVSIAEAMTGRLAVVAGARAAAELRRAEHELTVARSALTQDDAREAAQRATAVIQMLNR